VDHPGKPPRFYAPGLAPALAKPGESPGQADPARLTVPLPPSEGHHAVNVLRLKEGAAVELFDGRGGRARGRIEDIRRGHVVVLIEHPGPRRERPQPIVHVAFAVPKGNRLDWLLEKTTELGAASLRPTIFDRSIAGAEELSIAKRERWFGHCVAAAKQSRLDFLPEVAEPAPLPDRLSARGEALGLLGDLEPDALPLPTALGPRRTGQEVLVLVGPEGGLAPEERESTLAAGFLPVRLGHTTLRIETAAVAILAAVSALSE